MGNYGNLKSLTEETDLHPQTREPVEVFKQSKDKIGFDCQKYNTGSSIKNMQETFGKLF